jgi:hypothetical protein
MMKIIKNKKIRKTKVVIIAVSKPHSKMINFIV